MSPALSSARLPRYSSYGLTPEGARYRGPYLCTHGGDLSRQWHVRYKLEYAPNSWRTMRVSAGVNVWRTPEQRLSALTQLASQVQQLLAQGTIRLDSPLPPVLIGSHERQSLLYQLTALLDVHGATLTAKTRLQHRYAVSTFSTFLHSADRSNLEPWQLSAELAQRYADWLVQPSGPKQATPNERPRKALSARTHNNLVLTLRTLSHSLARRGVQVGLDVGELGTAFDRVQLKPTRVGRNFPFSAVQRDSLLAYIAEHDEGLYRLVLLIYGCFIRPRIEARGLRLSDLDLKHGRLLIRSSVAKNGRTEAVAIPKHTARALAGVDLSLPGSWFVFGDQLLPGPTPSAVNCGYERHRLAMKAMGISGPHSLYSWKDTGNLDAANAGVPMHELMIQNRHTDLTTTTRYFKRLGFAVSERMGALDLLGA
jgi:integrase